MSLHEMRLKSNLSQSQLADKANVNVRTLQSYEQGEKNIDGAKLGTLIDLATALNCNVSDILRDDELKDKCKNVTL